MKKLLTAWVGMTLASATFASVIYEFDAYTPSGLGTPNVTVALDGTQEMYVSRTDGGNVVAGSRGAQSGIRFDAGKTYSISFIHQE